MIHVTNTVPSDFLDRAFKRFVESMSADCRACWDAGVEFTFYSETTPTGFVITAVTKYLCAVERDASGRVTRVVESNVRSPLR